MKAPGFQQSATGGVHVAAGDFNGDGTPDFLIGPGAGAPPLLQVRDGKTGDPLPGALGGFLAFAPTYLGGVDVAVADVNGDGIPDIVAATSAATAQGHEIRVFSGANGQIVSDFFVTGADFANGISVAAGGFHGQWTDGYRRGGRAGW